MIMPSIRIWCKITLFSNTENVFHKIIEFCCFIHAFTHSRIILFLVFQAMLLLLVLLAGYEGMLNYYKVIRLVCKYL